MLTRHIVVRRIENVKKPLRFLSTTFRYKRDSTVSNRLLIAVLVATLLIEPTTPVLVFARQAPQPAPVSTLTYHLTDHLGSVTVSTDEKGNIVELNDYYPYGSIRVDEKSGGSSKEHRKHIGQEVDN